jgi:hypothetical protein
MRNDYNVVLAGGAWWLEMPNGVSHRLTQEQAMEKIEDVRRKRIGGVRFQGETLDGAASEAALGGLDEATRARALRTGSIRY